MTQQTWLPFANQFSGDELYGLAEWLNDHREACFHWPGNLLVKPLQEAWADGKLSKTEMRQIGRILIRIRKEWGKLQSQLTVEQATEFASELSGAVDLSVPALPSIPFVFQVRSQTQSGVSYQVDLSRPTCNCLDWSSTRSKLPDLHLSRCCKHVLSAYSLCEPDGGWPSWLGAFLGSLYPPYPQQEWIVLRIGSEWVLASTAPTGWANVYAREDESYERFGYNVREDRWSYMMEPAGSSNPQGHIGCYQISSLRPMTGWAGDCARNQSTKNGGEKESFGSQLSVPYCARRHGLTPRKELPYKALPPL
jgi:hypothetical protein